MATLRVDVDGLGQAETALSRFGAGLLDLAAFLAAVGRTARGRQPSALATQTAVGTAPKVSGLGEWPTRPGRDLRVRSRSAHIRDCGVLRPIPPARRETHATPTPNPHRRRRARRAVSGPGLWHAPSGPDWRSRYDCTRGRDQALYRRRGHVATEVQAAKLTPWVGTHGAVPRAALSRLRSACEIPSRRWCAACCEVLP